MGKSLQSYKRVLGLAPAFQFPDYTKPFDLYIHTKKRVASEVLMQKLRLHQRPVAFYSVQLDLVAAGAPAFIRSMSVTATIQEKLNL